MWRRTCPTRTTGISGHDADRHTDIAQMWAQDFFYSAPRAKTLKTHLRANNHFARWWGAKEYWLRDTQRLNNFGKTLRLFGVLAIYLIVTAHMTGERDWEYGKLCLARLGCKISCVMDRY